MKDKIIEILKAELFPIQLVDDSDPIEIMGVDKAADKIEQLYASQPAVSEGEIIHTLCNDSGEGTIIKTPQADAQQRYEKAKKLTLECTGNKILSEFEEDILSIAAGLSPQEKGGEG